MKGSKNFAAALLAVIMLLPFAACGKDGNGAGTGTGTESGTETVEEAAAHGYVETYGDFDAAQAWLETNINGNDAPPVYFVIGSEGSDGFAWTKSVGEVYTVTDYENSGAPAERVCRDIVYDCAEKQLRVSLTLTTYPNYPVVEYDAYLENLSGENTKNINLLASARTDLADGGSYTLHYSRGSSAMNENEYVPASQSITGNEIRLATATGMPTAEYLPYFNMENENGGGVISAVNWQGNWFGTFSEEDGKLRYSAGQSGVNFCMYGNERFKFPGTVFLFYKDGDWQCGQNIWRRWILEHNLMRYTGRRDYTQNLYICSDFSGPAKDISYIAKAHFNGLTELYNCVFELDQGWSNGNVGNWNPDEKYGNGGMKEVSDACHNAGMKFAVWFEPERVMGYTKTAKELGDKVIFLTGNNKYLPSEKATRKSTGLVNYGDHDVQDYIVSLISGAVKEYGIDVYRQDHNTHNATYWHAYDEYVQDGQCKRIGATENHACEGYISTWKRIAEENPGLIFDSCAGGGRRNDLETVRFSFIHTKSDYWEDQKSQQCQNFSTGSWYLITGTGFSDPSDLYDVRTRLTLSVGIGAIAINSANKKALEEWASLQKYMLCDFYQLSEFTLKKDGVLAMQFSDHEKGEGMMIAYLRAGGEYFLAAKCVESGGTYEVWNVDDPENVQTVSGETLMDEGYKLSYEKGTPFAAVVFFKKKV